MNSYCYHNVKDTPLYLGYFNHLGEVRMQYPEGGKAGNFFVNGETASVWIWESLSHKWMDCSRAENPLAGMVTDPQTFIPSVKPFVRSVYFYLKAEPGDIEFCHFKNKDESLSVTVDKTAIISLFWDGERWDARSIPFYIDVTPLAKRDLSNVDEDTVLSKITTLPPEKTTFAISGKNGNVNYSALTSGDYRLGIQADGIPYVNKGNEKIMPLATIDLKNVDNKNKVTHLALNDFFELDNITQPGYYTITGITNGQQSLIVSTGGFSHVRYTTQTFFNPPFVLTRTKSEGIEPTDWSDFAILADNSLISVENDVLTEKVTNLSAGQTNFASTGTDGDVNWTAIMAGDYQMGIQADGTPYMNRSTGEKKPLLLADMSNVKNNEQTRKNLGFAGTISCLKIWINDEGEYTFNVNQFEECLAHSHQQNGSCVYLNFEVPSMMLELRGIPAYCDNSNNTISSTLLHTQLFVENGVAKSKNARSFHSEKYELENATFNDNTGTYSYSQLHDITEEEMRIIYDYTVGKRIQPYLFSKFPIRSTMLLRGGTLNGKYAFSGCAQLETANMESAKFESMEYMFENCTKLKGIYFNDSKYCNLTPLSDDIFSAFSGCTSLKDICITKLNFDLNLFDSPDFSKESILVIINNRKMDSDGNAVPITLNLHATALSRLTEADLALASAKNITITSM